jgi:hypothetical protein
LCWTPDQADAEDRGRRIDQCGTADRAGNALEMARPLGIDRQTGVGRKAAGMSSTLGMTTPDNSLSRRPCSWVSQFVGKPLRVKVAADAGLPVQAREIITQS